MKTIGGDGSKTELVMKKKGKHKSTTGIGPASHRNRGERRRATTTHKMCLCIKNPCKIDGPSRTVRTLGTSYYPHCAATTTGIALKYKDYVNTVLITT